MRKNQVTRDKSDVITLVERHIISKNHPYYEECDNLTFLAKNLYNATLYEQRQSYFNKDFKNYYAVNREFTHSTQVDCRMLPAKVSKQIQMLAGKAFKSYFKLLEKIKDGGYDKVVKVPSYLKKKTGRMTVPYEKGAISTKIDGFVSLSKTNILIKTQITKEDIRGARIVPKGNHFIIEILYDVE